MFIRLNPFAKGHSLPLVLRQQELTNVNGKLHFLDNQPPCVFEKASVSLRPPSSEFMINCGGIDILSLHNDYNVSGPASSKVHLFEKF